MLNKIRRNKASAILFVLIIIAIAGVSITSLIQFSNYQMRANQRYNLYLDELNTAESVINTMLGTIYFYGTYKPLQVSGNMSNFHNAVLAITGHDITNYAVTEDKVECSEGSDLTFKTISAAGDPWLGYPSLRVKYTIQARVKRNDEYYSTIDHPGVKLKRTVTIDTIPLYIFGIFYDNLLEVWPGANWDMYGKVHSNLDLYLGCGATSNYQSARSAVTRKLQA